MKVGITINDYYSIYLKEIAKLNNCTVTSVCGLMIENFLSFNKKNNRYPLFQKQVNIVYSEKASKIDSDNNNSDSGSCSVDQNSKPLTREQIDAELKSCEHKDMEIHDDNWMPF